MICQSLLGRKKGKRGGGTCGSSDDPQKVPYRALLCCIISISCTFCRREKCVVLVGQYFGGLIPTLEGEDVIIVPLILCTYRNLPFEISPEEMYDIFGKYGAIRQIRL